MVRPSVSVVIPARSNILPVIRLNIGALGAGAFSSALDSEFTSLAPL